MPPIVSASRATTIAISRRLSDKLVPGAEYGRDSVAAELSAQVLDVRVDGAVESFEVLADAETRQLVAAEDAAGRAGHGEKKPIFGGGERDRGAVHRHLAALGIDRDRAGDDARRRVGRGGAAQHRLHARDELARAEGLGQVIVSAEGEAGE